MVVEDEVSARRSCVQTRRGTPMHSCVPREPRVEQLGHRCDIALMNGTIHRLGVNKLLRAVPRGLHQTIVRREDHRRVVIAIRHNQHRARRRVSARIEPVHRLSLHRQCHTD